MIGNYALYLALLASRLLLRVVPLGAAYALAEAAGSLAYRFFPIPRNDIIANLSVVTGEPPNSPRVGSLAREAFITDAKNWVDTLRIGRVTDEEILSMVEVDNWERLVAASARGRGVIIVMLHLGNFDLVGQVLAARGYRLTVPVERVRPERLFNLLTSERRSRGLNAVPLDQAPREMVRALRAGELVAMAGDRGAGGRPVEVDLFGKPALIPRAAVSLARRTGSPVLVGVGLRREAGRYHGILFEEIPIARTADVAADDRENAQRLARVMEEAITQAPGQWLMFKRLWKRGPGHAATMGHASEAVV